MRRPISKNIGVLSKPNAWLISFAHKSVVYTVSKLVGGAIRIGLNAIFETGEFWDNVA